MKIIIDDAGMFELDQRTIDDLLTQAFKVVAARNSGTVNELEKALDYLDDAFLEAKILPPR